MPSAVTETRAPIPVALKYFALRLFLATCAASVADFLFFDERLGLGLALFFAYLGVMLWCLQKSRRLSLRASLLFGGFLATLLPLIEEVDFIGKLFALMGFASFSLMLAPPHSWPGIKSALRQLALSGVGAYFFLEDLIAALRRVRARLAGRNLLRLPLGWAVPAALGLAFLFLFMRANPLIEAGMNGLLQSVDISVQAPARFIQGSIVFLMVWPLLRRYQTQLPPSAPGSMRLPKAFHLTDGVSLGALIAFNLLFAVQNLSDLLYLWGGARLPQDMTYASYAHRGAYALMAASLLAAGFSLLTARHDGPMDRVPRLRPLLLLWTGQCLFLVLSAFLRLDLYVEAYALTHFRLAALVWTALVGLGFGFILIWLLRRASMASLLRNNGLALLLTLYGGCFVDADAVIARYNFAHSREGGGSGPALDTDYLLCLGAGSLPTLAAAIDRLPPGLPRHSLTAHQTRLLKSLNDANLGWRGWSFRAWRQQQALATRIELARKREARDGASHSSGR